MVSITKIFHAHERNQGQSLSIGMKLTLYYLGLLIFSLGLSGFLYYRIYASITAHKVSDISYQMLGSVSTNINALIDNVNNYSKMVLADPNVQDYLRRPQNKTNLSMQRSFNKYLINMVETIPLITAIYIFDYQGNHYGADKLTVKTCRMTDITKANWYREVAKEKGGYILKLNTGEIFREKSNQETYISLIRVINDLNTQQPIGILIMNIANQALVKSFSGLDQKHFTGLVVKNEANQAIFSMNNSSFQEIEPLIASGTESYYSLTHKFKGKWYLVSKMTIDELKWQIISVMPFAELTRESQIFIVIAFAIILLNGLLLLIGFISISQLITVPIRKLLKSMKDVEQGKFNLVDFETGDDEIGKLKDGFNIMVQEIRKLIDRTVEEQRIIRKTELEVLQAQIKPHFLYNTFDAISSLALAGRSQEVYTIIKSLGSYYRISLSKGNQIITVGEELETLKNYLTIQQIRYNDLFEVDYQIEAGVGQYKVIKLILQPLVENAIYHGIRPKGEKGTITVSAREVVKSIKLTVADDGVGMDPKLIADLMSTEQNNRNRSSFGLRGTIERLRIYYGIDHLLTINSEKGRGTIITIQIPLKGVI